MKELFFLLLLSLTTIVKAQIVEFLCATDDIDIPNLEGVYSNSIDENYLSSMEPVVLNIYYWRVDAPDGSIHPNALTEKRALESIAYLNANYNSIGVFFKYRGMGSFSSPTNVVHKIYDFDLDQCVTIPGDDPDGFETLSRCQRSALISYASNNGYVKDDAISFYVPRGLTDFGGSSYGTLKSITSPGGLISNAIIHELGHNFSLPHTWVGWYQPNNTSLCEHVTRIPTDSNFNANLKGDRFVGTAAMPDFLREYCVLNGLPSSNCTSAGGHAFEYYDRDNCIYTGADEFNRNDCEGTLFDINPDNARNTMSYAPGSCRDTFSIDQGIKMREYIQSSPSLQNATNIDASSLYEPYKGAYFAAGPYDPSLHKPLFQPGFSYRFVECSGDFDQPAGYEEYFQYNMDNILLSFDIDEKDFDLITHPNHSAVYIPELKQFSTDTNSYNKPRKCYNNYNKNASGGNIIKFNDGVFNTNVTITSQDSTSINNQNLINNLPQGLYKIEKNYEAGAVQETVILKGNN